MPASSDDIGLALMRCVWRLDALDEWRKKVEKARRDMTTQIENLARADQIAKAVSAQMKRDSVIGLTSLQKIGAFIVGVVLLADSIKGLIS